MSNLARIILITDQVRLPILLILLSFIAPFTEWINDETVNYVKSFAWILVMVAIVIIIISGYAANRDRNLIDDIKKDKENLFLVLFLLVLLLSCIRTNYNNLFSLKTLIIFFSAFFYVILSGIQSDERIIRQLLKITFVAGILVLIVSYAQIISGSYSFFKPEEKRLTSIYWDANIFARYLTVFIVMCTSVLMFMRSQLKTWHKLILGITIILCILPLFLTYSRGGMILIVIGLISLIFFYTRNKLLLVSLVSVSLIIGFLGMSILKEGERFKKEKTLFIDMSNLTRIFLVMGATEVIRDYFYTGVGFDNFDKIYLKKYQPAFARAFNREQKITSLHNSFLKIWAELGLIGFVFFLAWNIVIIWKMYRYKPPDPLHKAFKAWIFTAFLLFIIFGQIYHLYLLEPIFWLIAFYTKLLRN